MGNLKYKMITGKHVVAIKELSADLTTWQPDPNREGLTINENPSDDLSDTLLEIEIDGYFLIYYRFELFSTGLQDFMLYINDETGKVFLGGRHLSCCVNMKENKVEEIFVHCLFWDFIPLDNKLILELGELEVLLRDANGKIIISADVEPPYEFFYEEDGIRFEFDSAIAGGQTYLKYDKN